MTGTVSSAAPLVAASPRSARSTLATCGGVHALHDGFSDAIYLFLPLWQAELGLTLAQAGGLKAVYSLGMAGLQLPASMLAERVGARAVLAGGTALVGLGFLCAGWSGGFWGLALAMLLTGIGAAVQHPLSSSLISHAATGVRLRVALSTYNFLGDVGKVVVPAAIALAVATWSWRPAIESLGVLAVVAAIAILPLLRPVGASPAATPAPAAPAAAGGETHWPRFATLAAIAVIDSAGRGGALMLLPFVLTAKGAEVSTIGLCLSLVFAGGAAGKFACGLLAIRFGAIGTVIATEIATAAAVLALGVLPLHAVVPLLPLLGLALNGTSSVLYGSVPETVSRDKLPRAFGLFYTLSIGGGATAPFIYGWLSDWQGLQTALVILAVAVLMVLPLTIPLRAVQARHAA